MKLKKLLTSLVVLTVGFSSLSALSVGGKYFGDFEVGINQGFPIEWEKLDDQKMQSVFYNEQFNNELFVTSTGFDLLWSWHNSIGASLTFDWGYTNSIRGIQPSLIFPDTNCNFKAWGSSFYFKVGPAFQFGSDQVSFLLTPGLVFSNITLTRTENFIDQGQSINAKISLGYPFGLGVGTKLKFNINRYFSLNAGVDVDLMLTNSDIKITATASNGQSASQTMAPPHEILLNVMPKIGVTARF